MSRSVAGSLLRAAAAVGVLAVVLQALAQGGGARFSGTRLRGDAAPALALTDDRGAAFSLDRLRGHPFLVYFGYVHCPDVCPMTLASLAPVYARLGAEGGDVPVLFVSLDPARDDPASLSRYVSAFTPRPIGLTGTQAGIAAAALAWHVTWRPSAGGAYLDHSSALTLVGPDGRERVRYGVAQLRSPAGMASDIDRVLHGG